MKDYCNLYGNTNELDFYSATLKEVLKKILERPGYQLMIDQFR